MFGEGADWELGLDRAQITTQVEGEQGPTWFSNSFEVENQDKCRTRSHRLLGSNAEGVNKHCFLFGLFRLHRPSKAASNESH